MFSLLHPSAPSARWPGIRILVVGSGLIFATIGFVAAAEVQPVVTVTGGAIAGRTLPGGHGAVFRGVPFAAPPIGDRRWREPMPIEPWSGTRDGDKSGPPAMQASFGWNADMAAASREDCLYLDVWTPSVGKGERPVMVWIHGGGNVGGSGGFDQLYDGTRLIGHDVVLVVVEYRLGIFGFLAHPALTQESPHHASGDYGLLDQLAALQWVHDNIAKFGGDPSNVTVFGQSAGAIDILHLLTSPLAHGLIHRAIVESGSLPAASMSPSLAHAEAAGVAAVARLDPPAGDPLKYLRGLSPAEILAKAGPVPAVAVDGWVLKEPPVLAFAQGRSLPVPLLIGTCAMEFPIDGGIANCRTVVAQFFGKHAEEAERLYAIDGEHTGLPVDPLLGGTPEQLGADLFRCGAILDGEWHAKAGHPTWEYQFDRAIPPRAHVAHSSDLPYVFGNLVATGSQGGEFTPVDRQVSDAIQAYWTNFARTGNPAGPGLPAWPAFDATTRFYQEFGADGSVVTNRDQRAPFLPVFREMMLNNATK
ncbi:MAG TPA: carboxylesterase family protein [Candidatus Didemnitutus sp.]|nr:carboxylesterase family protein [Candidatus Didemnitutus sp.]